MKTMFKAYTALLGYDWTDPRTTVELTNGYVATFEEAKAATADVKHGNWETGDWWIVATTMDEETFTMKEETVARYDWQAEVGYWLNLERTVEVWAEELKKAEAMKPKTEKGEARKAAAIAKAEKYIAEAEAELAKWPK